MLEGEIKGQICKAIRQAGGFPVTIWQGPLSPKGISDLLVCYKGKFYAIEVKTATGKATREQKRFLERVREAGGVGLIARSSSEVIEAMDLRLPMFDTV